MHALVYTGTQKIDYREEKDPTPKPGESIIKVKLQVYVDLICMPSMDKTKEEFHH